MIACSAAGSACSGILQHWQRSAMDGAGMPARHAAERRKQISGTHERAPQALWYHTEHDLYIPCCQHKVSTRGRIGAGRVASIGPGNVRTCLSDSMMVPTSTSSSRPLSSSCTRFTTHALMGGRTTLPKLTFRLYSGGALSFASSFCCFLRSCPRGQAASDTSSVENTAIAAR